jgi:hypothetical protein
MLNMNVATVVLAGFTDLYDGKYQLALKKIEKYPAQVVIAELVGINYRLRGPVSLHADTGAKVQMQLINHWFDDAKYVDDLYKGLNNFSAKVGGRPAIIFNRAGCLFGIDYCYRNLEKTAETFTYTKTFWIDLIEFCLACNNVVTEYDEITSTTKVTLLEHVNAGQALLNELKIVSNPILLFNRYIELVKFFESDTNYQTEFHTYLTSLGLEPKTLIISLVKIYLNQGQNKKIPFWISIDLENGDKDVLKLLAWLSVNKILVKKHDVDLLMLYKWPVYKWKEDTFFVLDPELLLDKVYRQLINDFFFDHLQPKGFTYQNYKNFIGQFFEQYVARAFKEWVPDLNGVTFKHTSQLLFGNPKKELCDIYLRHKRNVLVCQIKSTGFSDKQKFEGSNEFYNGDTERFYKDAGIVQLVQSIEWLNNVGEKIDDKFLSKTRIHPVVVLNDKFFEIPFMPQVLNVEFQKRLGAIKNRFLVKDLIVMSVSSIERLLGTGLRRKGFLLTLLWDTIRYDGLLTHFNTTLDRMNIQMHSKKSLRRLAGYLKLPKN